MKQAPVFDGLSLDPFSLFQDGLASTEVDVGGRDVLQALVIASVIVVIDEGLDSQLQGSRQIVVSEQDAVLESLMPAFPRPTGVCLQTPKGILPWVCG